MGLSIDSLHSHLGWVYNIYRNTGIEIPFPIIADRDMRIARLYGMISAPMSNTSTVRSVFIIDDKQILRAILYYPQTTGRYIPEILRIIDSLKTADAQKVVTSQLAPRLSGRRASPDDIRRVKGKSSKSSRLLLHRLVSLYETG